MTYHPDMQKEAIWAERKRRLDAEMRRDDLMVPTGPELRKRREGGFAPADTLAGQFQSIMEAPDYAPNERARKLLIWANANRTRIAAALKDKESA